MGRKYNAFISYRHNERDTLVASALQTQLERFHIPKTIAEQTGIRKIDRIFRDQNELELTSDLGKDIDEALDDSEYLIVILSEAYRESKWCLHEIDRFLSTHEPDRILAVISQGEPPGIFPDALMRTNSDGTVSEPLAADYRMDFKQAQRIELPRLVSAMLGCEYDDLVLRNETWRRHRITAMLGTAFVLSAAAVSWLLYSNAQITKNFRQAQIHESKRIASEALEDLEEGLRLDAVSTVLSALPSDTDRPVTSEALYTLSRASLAYQLPYHIVETGRIDLSADILRMYGDETEHLLFLIDEYNAVHAYDTRTRDLLGSWNTAGTAENWQPVIAGRNLVFWTGSGITAVSPEGETIWTQDTRYSVYGTVSLSSDHTQVAAADVSAVELIGASDGSMLASLVLPEDESCYVYDLCWNEDDTAIALILRSSAQSGYRLGLFETEHGRYTFLSDIDRPDDFRFLSDGRIVVVSCDTTDRTFERDGSVYLYENEMSVSCYSEDGLLWETKVPSTVVNNSSDIIHTLSYPNREVLIISASDTVSFLDASDGSLIQRRQIGSPLLNAYDLINESMFFITSSGQHGILWMDDNTAVLEKLFPDHLTQAEVLHGSNAVINEYAILHDGNLSWFSSAFDGDLEIMNGTGSYETFDEGVFGKDTAAVRTLNQVVLYDIDQKTEIASLSCEEDELIYLLRNDTPCDNLGLLRTNLTDGSIALELRSMEDLSLVKTIPLKCTDPYVSTGVYTQIDQAFDTARYNRKNMMAISRYSVSAAPIAVNGTDFCYFENTGRLPVFHRISLTDGSESEITPDLSDIGTADISGADTDTPSFVLNETGTAGLLAVLSDQSGKIVPVLFDTEDGSIRLLEDTVLQNLCFAQNKTASLTAVCAADGITLYDRMFRKTTVIPYPGSTCLALYLDDAVLYALFSDGTLRSYDSGGTPQNTVILSFTDTDSFFLNQFRLCKHDDMLAVFEYEQLEFVDLSRSDTRPSAVIPEHVLAWSSERDEILVYTYNGNADSSLFYGGILPHYTTEQLIEKGRAELNIK